MIIITFVGGGERLIKGTTLKQLDQETARLGQINFTTNKDGYPFGECHGIAFKSNIADIVEVPDAVFDARVEAQKAQAELKKQVDAKKAKDVVDRKLAANAAWRSKPLSRLFTKKPFPEVG